MPQHKLFDESEALDSAMQAFWSRGFEATSIQDLVDCTGVNRASLYATYGDKHALFAAALRRYDEHVRRRILSDLEARFSPKEAIYRLLQAFTDNVEKGAENRGCFLTNTALELASHNEEIAAIVANSQADVEAFLLRMIKQAKVRGEISQDVKPMETARGLLAQLVGLIVLTRSRPDKTLINSIIQDAMRRLE